MNPRQRWVADEEPLRDLDGPRGMSERLVQAPEPNQRPRRHPMGDVELRVEVDRLPVFMDRLLVLALVHRHPAAAHRHDRGERVERMGSIYLLERLLEPLLENKEIRVPKGAD